MLSRQMAATLRAQRRSVLLLGPRQTGKSTLLRSLAPDLEVNLAHEPTFLDFASDPTQLEQRLSRRRMATVFIDEVQRLPGLLNTIQAIIDASGRAAPRFLLSGSSARKLRRGQANLLPGRVVTFQLGPLTATELGARFDLERALAEGTLPGIYLDDDERGRRAVLLSYASTYLKEEVQAEALTRNLEGFARFLKVAAARSGSVLDLSKLASQAQVPRQSALRYFEILEDTLLVRRLEVFSENIAVRTIRHPRYYFFDVGVLGGLLKSFAPSEDRRGVLFEHLFLQQLVTEADNRGVALEVSYFRTEGGAEVDFVVELDGRLVAIECKASRQVTAADTRHLRALAEHHRGKRKLERFLAYTGAAERTLDGVHVLPWQKVLAELW